MLAYSAGALSSALALMHVRDKGEIVPLRGPDWDAAPGVVVLWPPLVTANPVSEAHIGSKVLEGTKEQRRPFIPQRGRMLLRARMRASKHANAAAAAKHAPERRRGAIFSI